MDINGTSINNHLNDKFKLLNDISAICLKHWLFLIPE